jgi:hypothetical protein
MGMDADASSVGTDRVVVPAGAPAQHDRKVSGADPVEVTSVLDEDDALEPVEEALEGNAGRGEIGTSLPQLEVPDPGSHDAPT